MTRRLMIAMGLWFLLLIVMMNLFNKGGEPEAVDYGTNQTEAIASQIPEQITSSPEKELTSLKREVFLSNRVALVRAGNFEVGLNRLEGSIDSLKILRYEEKGEPIEYVEKFIPEYPNLKFGFEDDQSASEWDYEEVNELEHVFRKAFYDGPARGLVVEKTYRFKDDPESFDFDLEVSLLNNGAETWANTYQLVWGSPTEWLVDKERRSAYDKIEIAACHTDSELKRYDSFEDNRISNIGALKWVGFEDRYFLFSFIPLERKDLGASVLRSQVDGSLTHVLTLNSKIIKLEPGKRLDEKFKIFLGPKKYSLLTADQYQAYRLDTILDNFVLIKWLGIAFEQLIFLLFNIVPNYAIVIILVTIIIKILLHPLTKKSFVSMRKMQVLQPKLAALKEQYKSNPQKLNEETMKLYKKEGVNPMGGCLPMLLQLPVFIALYQVLPRLADIKNVSFLWIKDLSSPDTVMTIEAFKNIPLLPYHLNILPIIMTAFSIFQSKLSSTKGGAGDQVQNQQGKMMMLMPVLFLFLFWNMPSGLVLYWTTQTVVSMFQQLYINKKYAITPQTR